jgi:4'-phosphopantetheinyl transferase
VKDKNISNAHIPGKTEAAASMSLGYQSTDLPLKAGEIHAWLACLEKPPFIIQRLAKTLSSEEKKRASRYRFERDKNHFILSHGILRTLLGRYLSKNPDQLKFVFGDKGKPKLKHGIGKQKIHFSVSTSGGMALYAFTRGHEIGVDIEKIRDMDDMELIAEHFFSEQEKAKLFALRKQERKAAFFNCWTRKEAYLKALGTGFSDPLDKFEVSLTPGEPAKLLEINGNSKKACQWTVFALDPSPDYVAAIAIQNRRFEMRMWQWED